MGVGSPLEILYAVKHGVDMFDSVMPTRIARNGTLFTTSGRVNIKSARYEHDQDPADINCGCYVCRNFSRSYLRHIYRVNEIASMVYNTYHNLYFINSLMRECRQGIMDGSFPDLYRHYEERYKREEKPGDNN
jgi:queuine tRNA-ribosyltransferase